MTRRVLTGFWGRRVLPWLVLVGLLSLAYWSYSWHTTTPHDWRDATITGGVAGICAALVLYLILRTSHPTPQIVGIVAFLIGDAVLYGSIFANLHGWTRISSERRGDALRASVTVAVLVTVGGVLFYELVQWRHRRDERARRRAQVPGDDTVLYEGLERRRGRGRRIGDR